MDRNSVIQALRAVTLFRPLRSGDLGRVADLASIRTYRPGATIVQQGDTAVALYCILSGQVSIQRDGAGAEPGVTLAELGPGGFFGEMSLLDDFPRSATVVATAPTECALISKWDFQQQLKSHPEIALLLLRVLSERVRLLDERLSI